jgi:hypothetical protein
MNSCLRICAANKSDNYCFTSEFKLRPLLSLILNSYLIYSGLETKDMKLLQEVQTDIKDSQIFIKVSHNYYSFILNVRN